jgi:hypothetical protein
MGVEPEVNGMPVACQRDVGRRYGPDRGKYCKDVLQVRASCVQYHLHLH